MHSCWLWFPVLTFFLACDDSSSPSPDADGAQDASGLDANGDADDAASEHDAHADAHTELDGEVADGGDDDGSEPDGGAPDGDVDASEDAAEGDGAATGCAAPDTECPANMPFEGAPCEGTLECDYPAGMETWTFTCEDGRWSGTATCDHVAPGGSCPMAPLVEVCDPPFEGSVDGGSVALGPASDEPFRPFTDHEEVDIVLGGQGLPMIEFRLQITGPGVDEIGCAGTATELKTGEDSGGVAMGSVRVRCGDSLRVFQIVPFDVCGEGLQDLRLEVTVEGVGTATVDVQYEGLGARPGPPCFG